MAEARYNKNGVWENWSLQHSCSEEKNLPSVTSESRGMIEWAPLPEINWLLVNYSLQHM